MEGRRLGLVNPVHISMLFSCPSSCCFHGHVYVVFMAMFMLFSWQCSCCFHVHVHVVFMAIFVLFSWPCSCYFHDYVHVVFMYSSNSFESSSTNLLWISIKPLKYLTVFTLSSKVASSSQTNVAFGCI